MANIVKDLKDIFKPAPKPIPIKMIKFEEKKIEKKEKLDSQRT